MLKYHVIYQFTCGEGSGHVASGRAFVSCAEPINTQKRILEVEEELLKTCRADTPDARTMALHSWTRLES